MVQNKLFDGLKRPDITVKLDTAPIDSFLERLLTAVKTTDEQIQQLKEENQKLTGEVSALKSLVKASDVGDLREQNIELRARVKSLEEKLKVAEGKIETKAEQADLVDIRQKAISAADAASAIQTDFTTFQTENPKWSKGVDSKLNNLQSNLNDQINLLQETKAANKDVLELKQKVEQGAKMGEKIKLDMDALQRLVNEFMTGIDAKIAHKADVEQLNDKMGRLETDDLLNQVTQVLLHAPTHALRLDVEC